MKPRSAPKLVGMAAGTQRRRAGAASAVAGAPSQKALTVTVATTTLGPMATKALAAMSRS